MIRIRNYRVERGGFLADIPELILSGKKNFVIGKNGSGKTTLLQSFAGIIESSGVFEVNGEDLSELPPERRNIGYIPQDLLLFGKMTVESNLLTSVRYGKGDAEIYNELVNKMHLESLLSKKATEISFGQAQKVAIARAIISKPKLVLMDEPFSFQDEISRFSLISMIDELSEKYGFDYLYATHNSRDLETGFSSLVSIDGGRVIEVANSIPEVRHFRTLSLMDYRNLAFINDRYYLLNPQSLYFNDIEGSEFDVIGNGSTNYVRFKIGENYFFSSINREPTERFVKIDLKNAQEIEY